MAKTQKKARPRRQRGSLRLTESDAPPDREGRYKSVYSNSSEVAHHWSANRMPDGRNGSDNIKFWGGTIYSYGTHFPAARHVEVRKTGRKLILVTTRTYSSTTSGHMSDIRSAIPESRDADVFRVPDVLADTVTAHASNLRLIGEEAVALLKKAKRARSDNKTWYEKDAASLIVRGNEYAEAVGLAERLPSPEGGNLQEWAARKIAADEEAEKKRKATIKKQRDEAIRGWEERLAQWQAGATMPYGPGSCPAYDDPRDGLAYVRVSRDKYLQTTLGMSVPLKDVLPVLGAIRNHPEAHGNASVGGFEIADWSGVIDFEAKVFQIGCHRIAFDEIERAAKAAGL